jgi:hypothetical protein
LRLPPPPLLRMGSPLAGRCPVGRGPTGADRSACYLRPASGIDRSASRCRFLRRGAQSARSILTDEAPTGRRVPERPARAVRPGACRCGRSWHLGSRTPHRLNGCLAGRIGTRAWRFRVRVGRASDSVPPCRWLLFGVLIAVTGCRPRCRRWIALWQSSAPHSGGSAGVSERQGLATRGPPSPP